MNLIDREGNFRARPVEWGLREEKSGAVAANIKFQILDEWDGAQWQSWSEYDTHHAFGAFYIIKKDGTINQRQVDALRAALGWNGNLDVFLDENAQLTDCQINIKAEDYEGKTRYKASWINPYDSTPGSGEVGNVGADRLKQLNAKFGSQLRAIAGPVSHASPTPNGKPKSPAAKPPVPTTENVNADLLNQCIGLFAKATGITDRFVGETAVLEWMKRMNVPYHDGSQWNRITTSATRKSPSEWMQFAPATQAAAAPAGDGHEPISEDDIPF